MVIGQTAWLVIMAAVSTELWWLSAGFVLLAVPSAMRLVPVLLGRARPGGLYLTQSGLEHAWGVRTTVFPWDRVFVCATDVSFRLCGHRKSDTKSFPFDIPADATDRAPRDEPPTPMAYLALEARSAVELIAMYAARPHLRAHLGTSRSLDWSPTPPSAVEETTALRQPWVQLNTAWAVDQGAVPGDLAGPRKALTEANPGLWPCRAVVPHRPPRPAQTER